MLLKHRIYVSQTLTQGNTITLDEMASHHLKNVLRLKPGQSCLVFNGRGGEFQAKILAFQSSKVEVALEMFHDPKRDASLPIHLAQGISKGERFDFVLQKSVELGVSQIIPLFTERCNVKLDGSRLKNRLLHWKKIIIHACQQSGRCLLPEMTQPMTLKEYLPMSSGLKLICHPAKDLNDQKLFHADLKQIPQNIHLLIGPEGGFTENELNFAIKHAFKILALGPRILRTETASIVALTLLQSYWGDI